jgi:PKD repeat protein
MDISKTGMWRVVALVLLAGTVAACADSQGPPPLAGPSTTAFSLTMTPLTEFMPRDGATQTVVTLTARDEIASTPVPGQRVALNALPFTATLSANEVTTSADGLAMFTVTAPPPEAGSANVIVVATPVGGAVAGLGSRSLTIPLIDTDGLVARFIVDPTQPRVNQTVTFDASGSRVEPGTAIATYAWSFGDGTSATSTQPTLTKSYGDARTYAVVLTVTDSGGRSATTAKNVTVVP